MTDPTPARLPGLAFILVEPRVAENVGATARAMRNFGYCDLRLVAPRCDHLNRSARALACHAEDVLEAATVYPDLERAVADRHNIFATTPHRPRRSSGLVAIREAAPQVVIAARESGNAALIFGREAGGLSVDELRLASVHITIPAADDYPILNLAQSVLLVASEVYMAQELPPPKGRRRASPPARSDEREEVLSHLDRTIGLLRWANEEKRAIFRSDFEAVLRSLPWEGKQLSILHTLMHAVDVFHENEKWNRPEDD